MAGLAPCSLIRLMLLCLGTSYPGIHSAFWTMKRHTTTTFLGLVVMAMTAAESPAPVDPLAGYLAAGGAPSGSQTLFAPWHVWAEDAGTILQNVTAASQEECAALCWQEPECALFDFRSCADEVRQAMHWMHTLPRLGTLQPCML